MAILLHDGLCWTYPTSICHVRFHDTTRPSEEHRDHTGTTRQCRCGGGSRRVFKQFAWLQVGSVKAALSRPGRAPGWCPIPPRRIEPVEITSTPAEYAGA
jgi:hypothetical protein